MHDRRRLIQRVRMGDAEAAHELVRLAIRQDDREACRIAFEVLGHPRAVTRLFRIVEQLSVGPGLSAWRNIVRQLIIWPEAEGLTWILDFLNERLQEWPANLRQASWRWWLDLQEGKHSQLWAIARRLVLEGTRLSVNGFYQLATTPELVFLESLALEATRVGDEGVTALTDSHFLTRLEELELPLAEVTEAGARVLATTTSLPSLKRLNLSSNPLGADGLGALGTAHGFNATDLVLTNCRVDDRGLAALAGGTLQLQALDVSSNRITDKGLQKLLQSPSAGTLSSLSIASNAIGDQAISTLARADLPSLRLLDLRDNRITDEGVRKLARGKGLPALEYLDLAANAVNPQTADMLRRSRNFSNLQEVAVGRGSNPRAMNAGRTSLIGDALKRALHDDN